MYFAGLEQLSFINICTCFQGNSTKKALSQNQKNAFL